MDTEGPTPEVQVLEVGIQIAQGLQAALDRGLIHRDIKPGNILFAELTTAKIVDFGLAVLQEHAGHVAGEVWATPFYVAPETVEGKPEDFRSDMYSLGATLYHALAGKPPHNVESNSMSALAAAKKAPVNLASVAPSISSATTFALNKVLNHDPAKRQQSYAEFIEHLEFARAGLLGILPEHDESGAGVPARRRSYGWLTPVTAAITVAVGVDAFEIREHLLHPKLPVEAPVESPAKKEAVAMTYEKARQLLATGNFAKAEEAFGALDARPDTPQPEKNWITLHAALTELLNGHADKANARLETLKARGRYSSDPAEEELGKFFVDTAGQAGGAGAISSASARNLNHGNFEAFALLLFGLKNWSLGNYDEAAAIFSDYAQVTPEARYAWVADYKPLVAAYLTEVTAYHVAADAARAADTLDSRKAALALVTGTRPKIKLATGFAAPLDQMAQDLQQKITAEEEETARRIAAMEAADAKALGDAKAKVTALWQQFRPSDAQTVMNAVQVQGEKARREREAWLKKLSWLSRFKAMLINDVNTVGYASAVQKRTGTQMPGPIKRANDGGIETVTPFGSLLAQWTELSPDSILAMAKSFLRADQPPENVGEREWLIGVYAYFAGKPKDGHGLLEQAAQAIPQHREDLNLFVDSPAAP
jgi:hypothetical protein